MQKEYGFTIIELMITLLIAAILLGLGVPAMQSFEQNNRITSQANSLISAIQVTRSEAIRSGSRTTICSSADGLSCSSSNNWTTGWIVFSDGSTIGTKDGTDTIIQAWSALSGDSTLSTSVSNIQYLGTGYRSTTSTISFILTRPYCSGDQIRTITVNPQGRPYTKTYTCP